MTDIDQLFAAAVRWQQQQRFEEALAAYQQVLDLQPDYVDALTNLGSVLKRLGRPSEAIACYRRVLNLKPDSAPAWFNLGNALQVQEQRSEAATAFQQAVRLQPNLAAAHFNLGKLLQEQGQLEAAKTSYQQTIASDPNLARAYTNLGNVLKALGQIDQAIAHHRQALHLEPDYAEAYNNLGTALAAIGQADAAVAAYQRALQLKPDLAATQLNLAEALKGKDSPPLSEVREEAQTTQGKPPRNQSSSASHRGKTLLTGRVLIAHHWRRANQRHPLCSHEEIYLTCQDERHSQVLRVSSGSEFEVKELLAKQMPGWEPDLLIAKVDSFFNLVPRQVEMLKCPKVLVLGDTHHGVEPLNRMIDYAKSEAYDFYITDHNRHHLWYYWLAGLKELYWLPTIFLNPPASAGRPFQSSIAGANQFQGKVALIGQVGKHHPRRRRLLKSLRTIPQFVQAYLPRQQDTLKAYASANISLNISLNGDLNLRTWEILSAKGFLLTDKLSDESGIDLLLEAGSEYETFANSEELLEKIAYFSQRSELVAQYRMGGHGRYCREYQPQQMIGMLNRLLQGAEIDDRFTVKSIKRIQSGLDIEYSRARISLYQIVQELHRQREHLSVLLDARVKFTSAVDFLDLPRLELTLTNYDQVYLSKLRPYLEQSGNQERIDLVENVRSYRGFNVIITAALSAELLSRVSDKEVVLLCDDYRGLEAVSSYREFQTTLSTREDFESQFFKLIKKADSKSRGARGFGTRGALEQRNGKGRRPDSKAEELNKLLTQAVNWHRQGDFNRALAAYQQVLAVEPHQADALTYLGLLLRQRGDLPAAETYFRRAWQLQPDSPPVLERLVKVLRDRGKYQEALALLRERLERQPDDASACGLLGALYCLLGQFQEAISTLQRSVGLDPNQAGPWANLGQALSYQGQLSSAISSCRRAIEINPNLPAAHLNLGFALNNQGRVPEAIACFRESLRIDPNFDFASSHLLYSLNYDGGYSPEAIAEEHRHWGKRYRTSVAPSKSWLNPRNPDRVLRLGYVSPDFRSHSIAYFIEPIFAHSDRTQVETFCYSSLAAPDAVTERLRHLSDCWRDVFSLNDDQLASLVRTDGIDILVDLAGHTAGNRLGAFAHKPAPIQVTYLGYPNTTGLDCMGYRFTDAWTDPPELTDGYYTEELIRLPRCFLCYQPPQEAPSVRNLPAKIVGKITFGSFNHLPKVTPEVIALWSQILQGVPGSRLILKSRWFGDQPTGDRYLALFNHCGIDSQRVKLVGLIPELRHHLAFYGNIDIALDPFPYNGTTTTCEALWMGVPVITLAGQTHGGRVGLSLLTTVGLAELIATTTQEYVAKAATLATDLRKLIQLRASLRERLAGSPLCDGVAQARAMEAVYRNLWQRYCQNEVN